MSLSCNRVQTAMILHHIQFLVSTALLHVSTPYLTQPSQRRGWRSLFVQLPITIRFLSVTNVAAPPIEMCHNTSRYWTQPTPPVWLVDNFPLL